MGEDRDSRAVPQGKSQQDEGDKGQAERIREGELRPKDEAEERKG
jgi:hypothetical protein